MKRYKYPSTPYVSWAEHPERLPNMEHFEGRQVVVTEKMDGENTTIYSDGYIHARSLEPLPPHPSHDFIKQYAVQLLPDLPKGYRLCGENLYSTHTIKYDNLAAPFLFFGLWKEEKCLAWMVAQKNIRSYSLPQPVPVLYEGVYDEEHIKGLYKEGMEGYVIRLAEGFLLSDFSRSVAKYVRPNHVQEDAEHWLNKPHKRNRTRSERWL